MPRWKLSFVKKWSIVITLGSLVAVLLVRVVSVPRYINSFKPQIEQAVQQATGRSFRLGGDLRLRWFTSIGIELGATLIGNDGVIEIKLLRLALYGGSLRSSTTLDIREAPPAYQLYAHAENIRLGELLKDAVGEDSAYVEGINTVKMKVSTRGGSTLDAETSAAWRY
jgi:uncharacterized protein involved in outer membrane biogenesis